MFTPLPYNLSDQAQPGSPLSMYLVSTQGGSFSCTLYLVVQDLPKSVGCRPTVFTFHSLPIYFQLTSDSTSPYRCSTSLGFELHTYLAALFSSQILYSSRKILRPLTLLQCLPIPLFDSPL